MARLDAYSHWFRTARRNRFVRNNAGIGGLTVAELGLGLVTAILLARALGAEGLGAYSLALAAVVLAGLPVEFGLPILVMREIAHHCGDEDSGQTKGVLIFAATFIVLMSGGVLMIVLVFADTLAGRMAITEPAMLPIAALLIPLSALVNTLGGALTGKQMVAIGYFPQKLVRPGAFAVLLGVAMLAAPGWLTPMRAMVLQVAAIAVALAVGGLYFAYHFLGVLRGGPVRILWREWGVAMLRLGLSNGIRLAQGQILVLITGILSGTENAGLLRIAQRGAGLVAIGTSIIYVSSAPRIAQLNGEGKQVSLQRLLMQVAWVSSVSTAIMLIGFVFGGGWLLDTLFGPEFVDALSTMIILGATESMRASLGPGDMLMNMTRREGITTRGFVISLVISTSTATALIPEYGADGAAWGMFFGVAGMSGYLWQKARRDLNLDPTVFGWTVRRDELKDKM